MGREDGKGGGAREIQPPWLREAVVRRAIRLALGDAHADVDVTALGRVTIIVHDGHLDRTPTETAGAGAVNAARSAPRELADLRHEVVPLEGWPVAVLARWG
eukprot:15125092-Alexandrium_andersonii.AAC.1